MKFQKLTLFLGLFVSLFVIPLAFGQTNTIENQTNQQKKGLIAEYAAQDIINEVPESALPPSERVRINGKKRRYDRPNDTNSRFNRDLTKLPPGTGMGSATCESSRPSSLPIEQTTSIIVGKITKAQPYLTESNTVVFTELDFEIEDVLKTNNSSITSRTSIKIDSESGALRLANGKVIRYEGSCVGRQPRQSQRYLLFLKPTQSGEDFTLVVGYELQNEKVFPLSETYIYTPATRKITKDSPYANTDESEFIQIVRDAITNSQANPNRNKN